MDPTLRAKVLDRLKEGLAGFSPRLQTVAKYITDHPADFGLDPIRVTSRKTGVSTYTLVRMAETLGFTGYDQLRAPFRQGLLAPTTVADRPDWLAAIAARGETGRTLAEAGANTLAIVERSLRQQEPERLERVVDLLLGARAVYLTATRATYALAYYFHYVGRMPLKTLQLIPRHMNSPIDELNAAEPGDVLVAITVAPYSRDTIEACRFAQDRGVRLILIADSDMVAPELRPEEVLAASTLSTHYFGCFTGVMAVIETLIAILVRRGGAAAQAEIDSYERLRDQIDAYWTSPKKH